jgi:hypothetical protein
MIKFEYQFEELAPKIVVEMDSQSTLDEVVQEFTNFLRGAGYVFEGELDFVVDEAKGE